MFLSAIEGGVGCRSYEGGLGVKVAGEIPWRQVSGHDGLELGGGRGWRG